MISFLCKGTVVPQKAPTGDAFFQPELGWSVCVRVIRPDLDCWRAGMLALVLPGLRQDRRTVDLQALDVALLYENKEEGGSVRALPVAAPMPKSVSF